MITVVGYLPELNVCCILRWPRDDKHFILWPLDFILWPQIIILMSRDIISWQRIIILWPQLISASETSRFILNES
jgi:hypothetical protein